MTLLRSGVRQVRAAVSAGPFNTPYNLLGGASFSSQSAAGPIIDHETAMTFSAVYAAVRLISDTIASLPIKVYQDYPDGTRYGRSKPPWMEKANPELRWSTFVQECMTSLLLDGNAFIGLVMGADGYLELWPLDPNMVTVLRDPTTRALQYWWYKEKLSPEQCLHIPGLMLPGHIRGLSPVELARQTIGLGIAAEQYGASVFSNAAMPHMVITSDKVIQPEQAEAMATRFDKLHAGLNRAHRTAVLGNGAQVKELTMSNDSLQFLESRRFQVTDVARWFSIPPHMLGDTEKSTSYGAGIEAQQMFFVTHTLTPWMVRLESALTPLVGLTAPGQICKFDADGLLRGDSAARAALYDSMMRNGAYSANDIRRKEDENPYPGGDAHYMQTSYAPIGPDGALVTPAPAAAPPNDGGIPNA